MGKTPASCSELQSCCRVMKFLGPWVLRPFLQGTIRWLPLTLAMNGMLFSDPIVIARVVSQVSSKNY